ncbi:carbohydrate-binding family 9-like protein [Adhaeribacter swui]|uniref:Carbohydrate-binding family 9-like protein n=1 Tax=Adhaeribacter swui TaxID=2086471 RepID=A0A7G7GBI2_9BACT|nr:carbohydrate-binding family 9-like protein [Adhaeribacter swui]QNF34516.1 carbohydrate-binding family 9-like protein [Adhaeribacter swui]
MRILKLLLLSLFALPSPWVRAQTFFKDKEALFTEPKQYVTYFTAQPPLIDGNLNEPVWQAAPWSDTFMDIEGEAKPKPTYQTRFKMLWNDTCLFVAAELQEPQVWATLKKHDAIIYHDNDFEIFIDPDNDGRHYYEIEVNAFNTLFDLFLDKPYRNGGIAVIPWQAEGLQSRVQVQGTINQPQDTDKSWTVEMAIPFRAIAKNNKSFTPQDKDFWRINFSRVQWDVFVKNNAYVKVTNAQGKVNPEHNWVWSPQGVINMHFPERWGYLFFSRQAVAEETTPAFALPYAEKQKKYLWYLYYQQREYYQKHQHYARSFSDLGLPQNSSIKIDDKLNYFKLETSTHQFMAYVTGPDAVTYTINQDGYIQKLSPKKGP